MYMSRLLAVGTGTSLPTASGAGEVPVSSGAGTAYTATSLSAAIATGVQTSNEGLLGATAGAAVIGDGAGGIDVTSADVSAMLAASDAAAARAALGVTASASLLPLCPYATCDGPLTAVGRLRFDPALFAVPGCTLAVALEAVGDVSDAGLTGTATLHDLTDAADVATLSWTGGGDTDPTAKSAAVTPPAAARDYELRLDLASGTGYLTLGGAVLRLTWS